MTRQTTMVFAMLLPACGIARADSELIKAAGEGDLELVKQRLATGVDVDSEVLSDHSPPSGTALEAAAGAGHRDVVELLIAKGASLQRRALHRAASGGHMEIMELLITRGARLDAGERGQGTALESAAYAGQTEAAKFLLKQGAKVDAPELGRRTPLRYAVWRSWKHPDKALDVARVLIEAGADVNATADDGWSPVHEAACRGSEKIAELLIENGGQVNRQVVSLKKEVKYNGMTATDIAGHFNQPKLAEFLRKHGGKTGAECYAEVQRAVDRALKAIDRDLRKLEEVFPQLAEIEQSKFLDSRGDWISRAFHYRKASTPLPWNKRKAGGREFTFGKNGCYILVEFRLYEGKSDPRFGSGAISARPGPHYQVQHGGVPFGLEVTVEAEENASGKAFTKRVNGLITRHLDDLEKNLNVSPVSWGDLVDRQPELDPAELEKEAYVVVSGKVTGMSAEVYENGFPKRLQIKVTGISKDRHKKVESLKVGDVLEVDPWGLSPAWLPGKGDAVRAYLKKAFAQKSPTELVPFYCPVVPNGIEVLPNARREPEPPR